MTMYYIFLFLIVSCVGQKNDMSNVDKGNITGKDVYIGIPNVSDPLNKLGLGNLKSELIATLTNGDVLNKLNKDKNIGIGNFTGKDVNIDIQNLSDALNYIEDGGNLKNDIIVALANSDALNNKIMSKDNIGISNVPGKDVNIDIPKTSDSLNKLVGRDNLKNDTIVTLTNGDVLNKKNEEELDVRVNNGVFFNNFGKDIRSKYIGSTLQKLNDIKLGFDNGREPGYKNYNYNKYDENEYKFEFDEGNPDFNEKIERPCEVYDTFCIRRFFAQHSKCKITGGPVPNPLFRAQLTVNYPRVDISAIQTNLEYRGLNNARVEEFYINKATDNLIIALEFDAITNFSNNTYLQFYLKGREPVVTRDFGGLVYGKVSITVIIPQLNDLRLDKAEIYTYANIPVYPFVTGPRLAESTDPEVLAKFAAFLADLPVNQQESLLTEGNFCAATFIQYNICDFGLKVL